MEWRVAYKRCNGNWIVTPTLKESVARHFFAMLDHRNVKIGFLQFLRNYSWEDAETVEFGPEPFPENRA